jgi:DNA modification methylase
MSVTMRKGDCREVLRESLDESVHCVVTSPPYFALRDYGIAGQIGLEPTPDAYVAEMVAVFREVRRVLRKDGTLWLVLGDSYAGASAINGIRPGNPSKNGGVSNHNGLGIVVGLKSKDLVGIPWRVAFALQADGWYLRQDIIWSKPNPMPESVTDRCTKAHEYIFLLSKSERYYYDQDAIAEDLAGEAHAPGNRFLAGGKTDVGHMEDRVWGANGKRNKRSVWEVTTQPFSEAHFATFPPALIEPCILAGCPKECCAKCGTPWRRQIKATAPDGRSAVLNGRMSVGEDGRPLIGDNMIDPGVRGSFNAARGVLSRETIGWSSSCSCNAGVVAGTVLDPFAGAGTTGLVADRLGRNAILIELNPEYAVMAGRRIKNDAPLFVQLELQLSQQPNEYDGVDERWQ